MFLGTEVLFREAAGSSEPSLPTEVGVPVEGILTAGTVDVRLGVRGNPLLPAEDLLWRFKQRQIFVSARTPLKKLILQRSRGSGDSAD